MSVHVRDSRLLSMLLFAVASALIGCPESPPSVSVDLQTGYLPGLELGFVQVELAAGSHTGTLPSPRLASRAVARGATGYSTGVRIADFDGLVPGVHTVRVVIRQAAAGGAPDSGALVGERRVIVNVTNSRVVRVAITADCRNHTCAASGGAFTECLNGVCVAPGCDLAAPDPALCCDTTAPGNDCATNPTPCAASEDCAVVADCVDATCEQGACVRAETDDCPPGAYCSSLEMACVDETPMPDAGIPDAPAPPDTGPDAPPCIPGVPSPLLPANGTQTGSVHNPTSLTPRFTWEAASGGCTDTTYELELEENCAPGVVAACAFDGPVRLPDLTETEARPTLEVSTMAPVGARYVWRVRACASGGCSEWSTARYVDVGRTRSDVNGDGYGDLVVGVPGGRGEASEMRAGRVLVFLGSGDSASFPMVPDGGRLYGFAANARFGTALATFDADGDGFADVAVGAPGSNSDVGHVYLFRGASSGLETAPWRTVSSPGGMPQGRFGAAVAGGDATGDGLGDLLIGRPVESGASMPAGSAVFYSGPDVDVPTILTPSVELGNQVGASVAFVGDVDRDGYGDFVVGGPEVTNAGSTRQGWAFVYGGTSGGLGTARLRSIANPAPQTDAHFGSSVGAAGDVDGDGASDLIIGAPDHDADVATGVSGIVHVFHGRSGFFDTGGPEPALRSVAGSGGERMGGFVASAGDFDGDGLGDLILGGGLNRDTAYVVLGRERPLELERIAFVSTAAGWLGSSGAWLDYDGDGVSDVAIGSPVAERDGSVIVYRGRADAAAAAGRALVVVPAPTTDQEGFGGALARLSGTFWRRWVEPG